MVAYAPYSRFKVGAALLTSNEKTFRDCHVEDSSYVLLSCGECPTIVHTEREQALPASALVSDQPMPCSPACRQVSDEFRPDRRLIFLAAHQGLEMTTADLLREGLRLE